MTKSKRRLSGTGEQLLVGQTSGSDNEIDQRTALLLKGDIPLARSSLLDIFNKKSWIKKSTFEGIFNMVIFINIMALVLFPLSNYYTYGQILSNEEYFISIKNNCRGLISKSLILQSLSFIAFFIAKIPTFELFQKSMATKYVLVVLQVVSEYGLFQVCQNFIIKDQSVFKGTILAGDGVLTNNLVICIQCYAIILKMHSYMLTNFDLNELYVNNKDAITKSEFKKYDIQNYKLGLYPYNVTFKNYARYLLIPCVVYEQDFPTTKKFNPVYFLGHFTLAIGNAFLSFFIFTEMVSPIISNTEVQWQLYNVSGLKREFDLSHGLAIAPISVNNYWLLEYLGLNSETLNFYLEVQLIIMSLILLSLYMIFESLTNSLAELAFYADRQFYVDWWNSVTVEEFIQKWFKIPYIFYYRHVVVRLVLKYQVNIYLARIIGFIVYSLSWDLFLWSVLGVQKLYIFKILMLTLTWHIIHLRFPFAYSTLFNLLALFGFLIVLPLLGVIYTREYLNIQTHEIYTKQYFDEQLAK